MTKAKNQASILLDKIVENFERRISLEVEAFRAREQASRQDWACSIAVEELRKLLPDDAPPTSP